MNKTNLIVLFTKAYLISNNFALYIGKHFLPIWQKPLEERKKCVSPDLKVTDTEAVASIKPTLDNFNNRLYQNPHVKYSTERIEKKYGNKAKFEEVYKVGNDGVSTVKYKVRNDFNLYLKYK